MTPTLAIRRRDSRPGLTSRSRLSGALCLWALCAGPLLASASAQTPAVSADPGDCSVTVVLDQASTPDAEHECEAAGGADAESFSATLFVGSIIDTFAPDEVGGHQNAGAGTTQKLRRITGIGFSGRLWNRAAGYPELWVHGDTIYGVRTADLDCTAMPKPVLCKDPTPEQFRYILEGATSLEAAISPTLYLFGLQQDSESPASVYLTMRLAFLALENAPRVFRNSHAAVGIEIDEGPFASSYLEVGYGQNELIGDGKWNRFKLDATLSVPFNPWGSVGWLLQSPDTTRFFVEMFVDNDLGGGADSVQTLIGLDFDLANIAGW